MSNRFTGPLLIVGAVLVVMHGFWLGDRMTYQQVDLLAFWLPRWCALGHALQAGHIPTWLPNQFGGVPFASDPQSGWLYLPVMVLFSVMSCTRALGLVITLNPIIAGVGLYGFLRIERLDRPVATVGGLILALSMAGSSIALSMPFSGMLAWTAVALAGAAGFMRSRRLAGQIGWLAMTNLALSQVAGAHLTDGLVVGVGVVGLYVLGRIVTDVRSDERRLGRSGLAAVALFGAFPFLAAAAVIPRLALLPRTSIGHGYRALGTLATQLSGVPTPTPLYTRGIGVWYLTAFARGPGAYVGAVAILLVAAGVWSKRWRIPALAFAAMGLIGWLLNLDPIISSYRIRTFALTHAIGELWLRSPFRFRYLLPLAFAGLAAYGLQSWTEMPRTTGRRSLARRSLWLAGPLLVFALLPIVAGAHVSSYLLLAAGSLATVPLLLSISRGRMWLVTAVPLVLVVELVVAGLAGQGGPVPPSAPDVIEQFAGPGLGHGFATYHTPFIDPAAYTTPDPIARALIEARPDHERYLTFDPKISHRLRGFLFQQDPADWAAEEDGRSVVFGLDQAEGYSPVQTDRYWRFVRRIDHKPPYYNSSSFDVLDPAALRVLAVGWVIEPQRLPPPPGGTLVATSGNHRLYRLADPSPRAEMSFAWRVVSPSVSLDSVKTDRDPRSPTVVLERPPTLHGRALTVPPAGTGTATYQEFDAEHVMVQVTASVPGLLVVRNAFDTGWRATVDGRPATVQVADYVDQGVAVPAGKHVVELTYHDGTIGAGLLVSAVSWLALLGLFVGARRPRTPRESRVHVW